VCDHGTEALRRALAPPPLRTIGQTRTPDENAPLSLRAWAATRVTIVCARRVGSATADAMPVVPARAPLPILRLKTIPGSQMPVNCDVGYLHRHDDEWRWQKVHGVQDCCVTSHSVTEPTNGAIR